MYNRGYGGGGKCVPRIANARNYATPSRSLIRSRCMKARVGYSTYPVLAGAGV